MHKDRILMAIEVLERVAAEAKVFDISVWFATADPNDCQTAACGLGWLCRDPRFQALGLRVTPNSVDFTSSVIPRFGMFFGTRAGAALLDITRDQAHWLFGPDAYAWFDPKGKLQEAAASEVSAQMVADRMRKLLTMPDVWRPQERDYDIHASLKV